jgi:hypothetical protein
LKNNRHKKHFSHWVNFLTTLALLTSMALVNCEKKKEDNTALLAAALASRGTGTATGTTSTAAPSGLTYTGSPFSFLQGSAITTVTPTVTGTVTGCTASPTLPAGLSLSATTVQPSSGH